MALETQDKLQEQIRLAYQDLPPLLVSRVEDEKTDSQTQDNIQKQVDILTKEVALSQGQTPPTVRIYGILTAPPNQQLLDLIQKKKWDIHDTQAAEELKAQAMDACSLVSPEAETAAPAKNAS